MTRLPVILRAAASTCLLLTLAAATAAPGTPTEASLLRRVRESLEKHGARNTLEQLYAQPEQWALVSQSIASGERAWLLVGRQLFAGADAGWAYDINLSFGEALLVDPALVLELAPELDVSCGSLDEPHIYSLNRALAEVDRREKTVRGVRDPGLAKKKDQCLAALAELRASLPKRYRKPTE